MHVFRLLVSLVLVCCAISGAWALVETEGSPAGLPLNATNATCSGGAACCGSNETPVPSAEAYLADVMDRYHLGLDVYTDADAAGNHFSARGAMAAASPENVPYMDEAFAENPHSGTTSIRCTFSPDAGAWSGWYFMNGILQGNETQPGLNWGSVPGAGVNLTGATKLTFWAKGERGDETVEFFAFGVGRDAETGTPLPDAPYPDSSARVPRQPIKTRLTTNWTEYTIDLAGIDLSSVLGGFGWVASTDDAAGNVTFYLDDIRYDKPRLEEPRFLVSYQTIPSNDSFDAVLRNTAFTYDNAVALMAFLAAGETDRARVIADALVYAQDHDRYYTDGRIRNAYQGGDLVLAGGWTPNGKSGTVRMPGWYSATERMWYEDEFQVSTHTGNVAWAMLALLAFYEQEGGEEYLVAAERMGEWVDRYCTNTSGVGGYTGGVRGWERNTTNLTWKSTEHNLDLYAAFSQLYTITGNETWRDRAEHARGFVVNAAWDPAEGKFWTGTRDDGVAINNDTVPLDTQTWSVLALDNESRYWRALEYAETHHAVCWGFDFNEDRDGIWYEGTAQMATAYRYADRAANWTALSSCLRCAGDASGGVYASDRDGLTTGFALLDGTTDWIYYRRLHVGATAWTALAVRGVNPFWMGLQNRTAA